MPLFIIIINDIVSLSTIHNNGGPFFTDKCRTVKPKDNRYFRNLSTFWIVVYL